MLPPLPQVQDENFFQPEHEEGGAHQLVQEQMQQRQM
jgi:hypothetical protein